jgi:hypothetical protein
MSVGAIRETHINADENAGYLLGEPIVTSDLFTDNTGELFRLSQEEYGRCVSRIYLDTGDGVKACGWVFQKRREYEDDPTKTYIHEVWVELLEEPDTVERTSHPYFL